MWGGRGRLQEKGYPLPQSSIARNVYGQDTQKACILANSETKVIDAALYII